MNFTTYRWHLFDKSQKRIFLLANNLTKVVAYTLQILVRWFTDPSFEVKSLVLSSFLALMFFTLFSPIDGAVCMKRKD